MSFSPADPEDDAASIERMVAARCDCHSVCVRGAPTSPLPLGEGPGVRAVDAVALLAVVATCSSRLDANRTASGGGSIGMAIASPGLSGSPRPLDNAGSGASANLLFAMVGAGTFGSGAMAL